MKFGSSRVDRHIELKATMFGTFGTWMGMIKCKNDFGIQKFLCNHFVDYI